MVLDELGQTLDEMRHGNFASISHDVFADLFHPENRTSAHAPRCCVLRSSTDAGSRTSRVEPLSTAICGL
jgi:hypothetical protein